MLSPVTAHRLLKLVDQTNLVIVEDDIFADFEHTPAPRLAAFDGLNRVIQVSSFSKTISASLRCGYIVAKNEWIENLTDFSVHDKFHRTLILSGFCFLKIAKISLNSSFFPTPIKR